MKKPIFATDRCQLFEGISREVWNRIILAHDIKVDLPEIGITSDIIVEILQFSKYHLANFDVYAKTGWNENVYGADIEIFIETNVNEYIMFCLQAKVLKKNNRYDTLRDSSDGIMQWDKLILLEAVSGCKSYYLLYNGRNGYNRNLLDQCRNSYTEEQLGCSLVEPNYIKTFATKKSSSGRYINPTFEDIHPTYAQPWRILTCCLHDRTKFKIYSMEEIVKSNPNLKRIKYEFDENESEEYKDESEDASNNDSNIPYVEGNNLNTAFREAKWDADLRIIVSRTVKY
jgi:hypothetical protein